MTLTGEASLLWPPGKCQNQPVKKKKKKAPLLRFEKIAKLIIRNLPNSIRLIGVGKLAESKCLTRSTNKTSPLCELFVSENGLTLGETLPQLRPL